MQGKELNKLEKELWNAADQLRANSKLTASEYSMPVLGLIFLRHAYNRFEKVKVEVEKQLPIHPQRGRRPLNKSDFDAQNAMFLPEKSQFEYLVSLPESADTGEAINEAMRQIEAEYENLRGVLPKDYTVFSNELLRELLRIFNKEVLQKAEGDLFGKIYEYFLNKFAMTGAQEGGEFFTPISLVQTIVNIIEPNHGTVFDPACGSAGMFVQTGYFIEKEGIKTAEKVTFFGQEKADLNTRLAKMNLAVHGLEGNIKEGNTFYEDKHNLVGDCDFVMANPPFNVNGVDKGQDSVKKDPRLVLDGMVNLPRNDNANYLWIQYFYNYLKPTGRAGFVMASSAADAGHSEKDIREKLVKTGAVDVMMAIGNNFFYTRSLPCTLWFFDRAKEDIEPAKDKSLLCNRDTVLMLDARKIYRKVTQKINDFSNEQMQNLLSIVSLYRGNNEKFNKTVAQYMATATDKADESAKLTTELQTKIKELHATVTKFAQNYVKENKNSTDFADSLHIENLAEVYQLQDDFTQFVEQNINNLSSAEFTEGAASRAKELRKQQDKAIRQLTEAVSSAQRIYKLNSNNDWRELNTKQLLDNIKELQLHLSGNPDEEEPGMLQEIHYYHKQAVWLTSRFPEGKYVDVEGLCKVVTQSEIEEKDWSLSPGRYVGVAIEEDEDFDYEARLKEIHIELEGLNEEAAELAKLITENYKGLSI